MTLWFSERARFAPGELLGGSRRRRTGVMGTCRRGTRLHGTVSELAAPWQALLSLVAFNYPTVAEGGGGSRQRYEEWFLSMLSNLHSIRDPSGRETRVISLLPLNHGARSDLLSF